MEGFQTQPYWVLVNLVEQQSDQDQASQFTELWKSLSPEATRILSELAAELKLNPPDQITLFGENQTHQSMLNLVGGLYNPEELFFTLEQGIKEISEPLLKASTDFLKEVERVGIPVLVNPVWLFGKAKAVTTRRRLISLFASERFLNSLEDERVLRELALALAFFNYSVYALREYTTVAEQESAQWKIVALADKR